MSEFILKLSNISKALVGVKVLENVSFDVEKGSRHALIGPNGAGKTTLFNVISGIHDPEKGTVYFSERSKGSSITKKEYTEDYLEAFKTYA